MNHASRSNSTPAVRELRTPDQLEALAPAWGQLARAAGEPNPFFEPWLAIPAMRHLARARDVRWLAVAAADSADPVVGDGGLLGMVPLEREPVSNAVPLPRWRIWRHAYCFLCTPLMRAGSEPAVWRAILDWLGARSRIAAPLELEWLSYGPVAGALVAELERRDAPYQTPRRWERALLVADGTSPDDYVARTVRKKKRKEYRRQRARLDEQGGLEVRLLGFDGDDGRAEAAAFAERFAALEQAGWKGEQGTAMASRSADRAFLDECLRRGAEAGALVGLELVVAGELVASKIVFRSGTTGFMFKIAFDERFARYSPGVLLELDFIEAALGPLAFAEVDSCAAPDHPMIDHLWSERRPLHSLSAAAGTAGALVLRARPWIRRLRNLRRPS